MFIHTSVIGSAGLGWSGGNCFFVGDVGATETGAPNPLMAFVIMITISIQHIYLILLSYQIVTKCSNV